MDSITVHVQNSDFSLGISIPNPSFKSHQTPLDTHFFGGCGTSEVNALGCEKNLIRSTNRCHKGQYIQTATKKDTTGRLEHFNACPNERQDIRDIGEQNSVSRNNSQMSSTLKWLTDNYKRTEGVCLPRCVLYTHYLDFCRRRHFKPAGAATFGKIIRQRFPKLTTRRLGTRGQSRYHYYGIGIKETSMYYHSVYTGKGLTRFSGTKVKTEGSSRKYSLSSRAGTLLPEFPQSTTLVLPKSLSLEKVDTFLVMYRTHCQRILDTVISANFNEVQSFLLHFWQGMPSHLTGLLQEDVITQLIAFCDNLLYKVLTDVLVPRSIQDLPDSLNLEIRTFIKNFPIWLNSSLEDVPVTLQKSKTTALKIFIQSINRQISFVQLAQTSRTVLTDQDTVLQILEDLECIDINKLVAQAVIAQPNMERGIVQTIHYYFKEFKQLLCGQPQVEAITEWLDNIAEIHVLQESHEDLKDFQERASYFLLLWSLLASLIMKDLTLSNAASYGPLHLIRLMFDEYVFLIMETHRDKLERQFQNSSFQKFLAMSAKSNTTAPDCSPQGDNANKPGRFLSNTGQDQKNDVPNCLSSRHPESHALSISDFEYPTLSTVAYTNCYRRQANSTKDSNTLPLNGSSVSDQTLQQFHRDTNIPRLQPFPSKNPSLESHTSYQFPHKYYHGNEYSTHCRSQSWNNAVAHHSEEHQNSQPYHYTISGCLPSVQHSTPQTYLPTMPGPQVHVAYRSNNYMDLASVTSQYDINTHPDNINYCNKFPNNFSPSQSMIPSAINHR